MGTNTDFVPRAAAFNGSGHQTGWERAQAIFNRESSAQSQAYLHWDSNRTAGQVAKALGPTDAQQRECAWISCLHIDRWRQRLHTR